MKEWIETASYPDLIARRLFCPDWSDDPFFHGEAWIAYRAAMRRHERGMTQHEIERAHKQFQDEAGRFPYFRAPLL